MGRTLQDIKLPIGDNPPVVLQEMPLPDGATAENVVHDRMEDHYADKTSNIEAVRVLDEEGSELCRCSYWDILNEKSARATAKVRELALKELERRRKSNA